MAHNSSFSDSSIELIRQIFSDAIGHDSVGNGVATGSSPDEWMVTLAHIAGDIGIPFAPIAPASKHETLKDLFNAHKEAILSHEGACIVAFDASENRQLGLTPDEYIEFNNKVEELLFQNGKAIYVHVMGGGDDPKVFVSSKLKPTPYDTQTKLEL